MEIHTHGHIHETKKWKEYVFQFIMLFLAITLGFFVENQREHYIENHRAEILAASLIQNLKSDVNEAKHVIAISDTIIMSNTSLIAELNKPRDLQNDSLIHKNGLQNILRFNLFDANSGNYEQVKFSGALRYFKPEIVNQLTSYESNKNYVFKMANLYLDFYSNNLRPFCLKSCNPRFLTAVSEKKPAPKPVFTTQVTPEFLDQVYINAHYIITVNKQQIRIVTAHSEKAEKLIKILSETYDIDESKITVDE